VTLTNSYATLSDLQTELKVEDPLDDIRFEIALNAASRQIDFHTGLTHGFWQDASVTTREFYADDSRMVYIPDGISTSTGLIVKTDSGDDGLFATTLTIGTNFILSPVNAPDQSPVQPWTRISLVDYTGSYFPRSASGRPGVQITAKFGWPAIPDDVRKACLIQAVQLFKASDAVFGAIQLGEGGFATRVGRGLNPMAESLLEGYCLPRVA
jgi:hypothetical protein